MFDASELQSESVASKKVTKKFFTFHIIPWRVSVKYNNE